MSTFLKNELEEANFQVQEIIDNVLSIENFISDQELEDIISIATNASEEDWSIEYLGNLKNFCLTKFGRDDVENLVAEGKFEITSNWADKNLNITNLYSQSENIYLRLQDLVLKTNTGLETSGLKTIQRMYEGVELKSHTDQHTDPSIKYATILYLNDDYVDGELFFVNKDLQLRPKPKTLLIFPGNEEFEHGVRHVGNGPKRYVIVGFIKERGHYEKNRY